MTSITKHFEFWLILTVGLVQFINILDFMMVMPLGPDFAQALGIPSSEVGLIGGSYTFAASLAGLGASLFLDNYCRKKVILFTLTGLLGATALAAFAWSLPSLMAARVLAGLFGGPLSATALAMVADYIPPERRGAALGKVMGAFAAASVLGVPFGLELAHWFSWRTPFYCLSLFGLIVLAIAWRQLPKGLMPVHQTVAQRAGAMAVCVRAPKALAGLAMMACSMMAGFLIIPNIAAHLQMNWGFPREHMGLLYLSGGLFSLFGMRIVGRWVDRFSATRVGTGATLLQILVLLLGFVIFPNPLPVIVIFTCFMLANSGRNVAAQSLATRIASPTERAGYMALQSSVTHMAMAIGSGSSSLVLHEAGNRLDGVPTLGLAAIALNLSVPFLFAFVERRLRLRDAKK